MSEQIKNNIDGFYRAKPEDLDDATLAEIATSPQSSSHNQELAIDEISKREETGSYDLDASLEESQEESSRGREQDAIAGKNTLNVTSFLDNLAEMPSYEKIKSQKLPQTEAEIETSSREKQKVSKEQEIDARRMEKSENRYDANYSNLEKQQLAEEKANLPIYESDISDNETGLENNNSIERALDKASFRLKKHINDYYIDGAVDSLSHGELAINPKGFIENGFIEDEGKDIEAGLSEKQKPEFWSDFKTGEMSDEITKWNSIENIEKAEQEALFTALEEGAYLEQTSLDEPEKLRLSLPINEYGDGGLQKFMKEHGVDPESKEAKQSSYEGFIGIIEAIKNNEEFKSDGFKALDWYFDNFNYNEGLTDRDGFLDRIRGYESTADYAWTSTLLDYLKTRPEYQKSEEEAKSDERKIEMAESIERVQPIEPDDFVKEVASRLGIPIEQLKNPQIILDVFYGKILPPEPTNRNKQKRNPNNPNIFRYPKSFGDQKILATYAAWYALILSGADPDAQIFQEEWTVKKDGNTIFNYGERYTVLRFGCKIDKEFMLERGWNPESYSGGNDGENHAIIEGEKPDSATYTWHGQGDGWVQAVVNKYKSQARRMPNVGYKYHDHNQTPADHMIQLFADMGLDLLKMVNSIQVQPSSSNNSANSQAFITNSNQIYNETAGQKQIDKNKTGQYDDVPEDPIKSDDDSKKDAG